ncbi:MerR family transcriptional regulator [Acidithiobacillus ferrianus]|uniref:MerR family DNA-binding transcriptional regulator n=2 Tax=Acidithiobacillus ferrianus TaxID=2678518 RepID=A0A845UEQ5_9PROT|nr:MerR family transcriptional regulator [Acidithiobacillus ferrianus]NDU42364.1 MerR family DNA-binding transcriptional regulator [Acidithiobacillus ferrianus]
MITSLTIQQAAKACGLTVHTLRYYERIGLIGPVPRQANRHRLYHAEDMQWLEFLLKLRTTGLPIAQMLRYAELRRLGNSIESVSERKAMLAQHTRTLEATLINMQQTIAILHGKLAMYTEMERQLNATTATREEYSDDRTAEHPTPPHPPTRR